MEASIFFEGGFFLINLGSGLPLRVDSDGQVSVSADARDAFARFALDAATLPGSFYVKSVGAGKAAGAGQEAVRGSSTMISVDGPVDGTKNPGLEAFASVRTLVDNLVDVGE